MNDDTMDMVALHAAIQAKIDGLEARLDAQLHELRVAQSKLRTILAITDRWETDNRRHTTEAMEDIIIVLAAMGGVA